jgi:hypothetical protein
MTIFMVTTPSWSSAELSAAAAAARLEPEEAQLVVAAELSAAGLEAAPPVTSGRWPAARLAGSLAGPAEQPGVLQRADSARCPPVEQEAEARRRRGCTVPPLRRVALKVKPGHWPVRLPAHSLARTW